MGLTLALPLFGLAGHAPVASATPTDLVQTQELDPIPDYDGEALTNDSFGFRTAISGDTMVVAAQRDSSSIGQYVGSAYVFVRGADGGWTLQQKLTASDATARAFFGGAVAINGDTIVIGNPDVNSATGATYVFTRADGVWTQQARLEVTTDGSAIQFGKAVAISGDILMIGASDVTTDYGPGTGRVYEFTRSAGVWTQSATIEAEVLTPSPNYSSFGASIGFDGTSLLVGAPGQKVGNASAAGVVYAFVNDGTNWVKQATLQAPSPQSYTNLGDPLALSGDRVLVGWGNANGGSGSAFVFERSGTSWSSGTELVASPSTGGNFGYSVALMGNTALVGAWNASTGVEFTFDGTRWNQTQQFAGPGGALGTSAAIYSEQEFAFGAYSQTVAGYSGAGAVYVYAANATAAATTTTLGVDPADVALGASYNVSATVTAGAAMPAGVVLVSDGGSQQCTIDVPAQTACALAADTAGTHALTAVFTPTDGNAYLGSTATASVTVDQGGVDVSIGSVSPEPSQIGETYTVGIAIAPVAPAVVLPTGTVTVTAGDGDVGCTITLPDTSCDLPGAGAGTLTLSANYAGDANYGAASAANVDHVIAAGSVDLAISAIAPEPSQIGETYTVTIAIAPSAPATVTPTGTVAVGDGSTNCTIVLPATSCELVGASAGIVSVSAAYGGDANYTPAAAAPVAHTVTADVDLAVSMDDGVDFLVGGQQVDYTIVVRNNGPADAVGATVQDLLPANLASASWTCTASANASCAATSGDGDIDQRVDIGSGGTLTYQLGATVLADPEMPVQNTVSATVASGQTDNVPGNNSMTDTDPVGVFSDGFDAAAAAQNVVADRDAVDTQLVALDAAHWDIETLGAPPRRIATASAASGPPAANVHLRRVAGVLELRLSTRDDLGLWQARDWHPLADADDVLLAVRTLGGDDSGLASVQLIVGGQTVDAFEYPK